MRKLWRKGVAAVALAGCVVLGAVSSAFAAGEPFSTMTVSAAYTQGADIWTFLSPAVYLALGIAFVLFIVRKGKGWIMGLFRR